MKNGFSILTAAVITVLSSSAFSQTCESIASKVEAATSLSASFDAISSAAQIGSTCSSEQRLRLVSGLGALMAKSELSDSVIIASALPEICVADEACALTSIGIAAKLMGSHQRVSSQMLGQVLLDLVKKTPTQNTKEAAASTVRSLIDRESEKQNPFAKEFNDTFEQMVAEILAAK